MRFQDGQRLAPMGWDCHHGGVSQVWRCESGSRGDPVGGLIR